MALVDRDEVMDTSSLHRLAHQAYSKYRKEVWE
jgi:hypothetical protein